MALGEKLFEESGNITGLILTETVVLIHWRQDAIR